MIFISSIILIAFCLWYKFRADPKLVYYGNKIPGPPALPFVGNILDIPSSGEAGIKKREQWIKKYGHTMKVWMGKFLFVFLSDPIDCEVILKSTIHLEKPLIYDFFHNWLGLGLLTSTGDRWFHRRKAITPTFHFKILEKFLSIFNKQGDILVESLKTCCNKEQFNIQPYISRYALDVICETAMGTPANAQINNTSPYVQAVRRICHILSERIRSPWLYNDFLFSITNIGREEKRQLSILHRATNKVIEERKKYASKNTEKKNKNIVYEENKNIGIKEKTAFLELLLKIKEKGSKSISSDDDIREEVDTFMFEGHDTTTASICFTLKLLADHPDIQEKVFEELNEFCHGVKEFTTEDLQELKYLECVIKESLRLYPSVPIIGRRIEKDVLIPSGYILPAGCTVVMSIYFSHRNESYYRDPQKFSPDNFLPEVAARRHPYAYIPFSAGPRNCIGQKFAMIELKSVLAKILLNFKLEPPSSKMEVKIDPDLILQSMNGHHIKLKLRTLL